MQSWQDASPNTCLWFANIEAAFDPDRFGSLIRNDLLEWEDGWLRVTAAGRTRLDAVVAHLLN